MNRRDLFKMIPGLAMLPFLRHWMPKPIKPLYYMRIGDHDVIGTAQIYAMMRKSDEEVKACTGISDRPTLKFSHPEVFEELRQRIIDEQRQRADCIKDLTFSLSP